MNSRLDELQAAILSVKLPLLDQHNARRRTIAERYLTGIHSSAVMLPPANQLAQDAWHQFVIRHPRRDDFRTYLHERGIGTEIHYPIPPHRQRAYSAYAHLSFPIAEQLHQEVVSLPLNPALVDDDVEYIIETINLMSE